MYMVQSSTHFLRKCDADPRSLCSDLSATIEVLTCIWPMMTGSANLYTGHWSTLCPGLSIYRRVSDLSLQRLLTNWLCNAELCKVDTRLRGARSQTAPKSLAFYSSHYLIKSTSNFIKGLRIFKILIWLNDGWNFHVLWWAGSCYSSVIAQCRVDQSAYLPMFYSSHMFCFLLFWWE